MDKSIEKAPRNTAGKQSRRQRFDAAVIFAVICFLTSFATVPAYAGNIASGTDWTFADNGTVTITSDAGMTDWTTWQQSNYQQRANVTAAVIGNAVTSVAVTAFYGCNNLASVTFEPISQVATIGILAFGYTALQTIEIPVSVTSIGEGAFTGTPLTGFTVAIGNTKYSASAEGALLETETGVTTLHTFPAGKTGSYTVESGVTKIGEDAFNSTNLTSVTITAAITDIGTTAFGGSSVLKAVTFEGSAPPTGLNANTFQYTDLTYILVPTSAGAAYKSALGTLESIVVEKGPDNVTVSTGAELKEALQKPYPTTITLTADITLDENATMNASHTLTVPTTKTLTLSGGNNIINIGANTLSINGGGTITVANNANGFYRSNSNMTAVLNLENITVNLQPTGNNSINVNTVNVNSGSTVILNSATGGGLIQIANGWTLTVNTGGAVNIQNFYVAGINNSGTVHINGGTVSVGAGTGTNGGIFMGSNNALLKITSGTLTGTAGGAIYLLGKYEAYTGGSKVEGAAGIFADRSVTLTNNGQIEVGMASDAASANGLTDGMYFWNGSAFQKEVITVNSISPDVTVTEGAIAGSLSVSATASNSAAIGYQWYKCEWVELFTDYWDWATGVAISGATGSSYVIPTDLTEGKYGFYVRLSANGCQSLDRYPYPPIVVTVEAATGLAGNPQVTPMKAYVQNGTLHVGGLTAGQPWSVYNISGALIYQDTAGSDKTGVSLPVRGVYIVKSDKDTVKAVY